MSVPTWRSLLALGQAQVGEVAPALEGSYVGSTAGTIGGLLVMLATDLAAQPARDAAALTGANALLAEAGRAPHADLDAALGALAALHAVVEADVEAVGLNRRILDFYVATTAAAVIVPPG